MECKACQLGVLTDAIGDLIETLWNVKTIPILALRQRTVRFNRNIVECKVRLTTSRVYSISAI